MIIRGADLAGIQFTPETPSAQVKSAVLLAGAGERETVVRSPPLPGSYGTRPRGVRRGGQRRPSNYESARGVGSAQEKPDHLRGGQRLTGRQLRCQATFVRRVHGGGGRGDRRVGRDHHDVGLNPTRAALFDVLSRSGAEVETTRRAVARRAGGTRARATRHVADVVIAPEEVPLLIDELPALAALATFGGSVEVRAPPNCA